MKKIRILAIIPYEGLKRTLLDVSEERKHIDMKVYVGDLEAGVKLARDYQGNDYDLILSRGGTARAIKQLASIPVVEIKLSEYDILHAIRLAQNSSRKFAIVGFANIIERVESVCRLLEINVETYAVNHVDEIASVLHNLKEQEYPLVVGDTVTTTMARQLQINSMLITSGKESVVSAIDEIELVVSVTNLSHDQGRFYREALDRSSLGIFVYTESGLLHYANQAGEEMGLDFPHVANSIIPYIPKIFEDGLVQMKRKSKGFLWEIKGLRGQLDFKGYAFVYMRNVAEVFLSDKAVAFQQAYKEPDAVYLNFFENSLAVRHIVDAAHVYAGTNFPILILGESGTGAEMLAWMMHNNSAHKNDTMIVIDCRFIDRRTINFLIGSENSPLSEANISIYFMNIHSLGHEFSTILAEYIQDTSLHRRNRVIYSSETPPSQWDDDTLLRILLHEGKRSCISMILPSLRESKEDILSLSGVCIHQHNITLGKQVAGPDAESTRLLQAFPWKHNINQLINVLRELVLITDGAFIQADATRRILEKEEKFTSKPKSLFLQGSLDKIISNVIREVLAEENMNQTKAAKRLGIGRSTMWRKLRE